MASSLLYSTYTCMLHRTAVTGGAVGCSTGRPVPAAPRHRQAGKAGQFRETQRNAIMTVSSSCLVNPGAVLHCYLRGKAVRR